MRASRLPSSSWQSLRIANRPVADRVADTELPGRISLGRCVRSSPRGGFTLIEVLAVVLVTSLVLSATISFYLNLTQQAARAAESTREVRRAAAIVDRVADDLEHSLLMKKPPDEDPLSRPWLFVAESEFGLPGELSSDQLKFIRRQIPRTSDGPASDVAMVAYTLHRSSHGENFELRRWSTSELPETLDRTYPLRDDPASFVVADDLRYFALRFRDEEGAWQDRWDSTQIADSSELPVAVEIEVALAPPAGRGGLAADGEPVHYTRQVALALRPIDLEELLRPKPFTITGQGTLGECIDLAKLGRSRIPGISPEDLAAVADAVRNAPTSPFGPYATALAGLPAVNPDCLRKHMM